MRRLAASGRSAAALFPQTTPRCSRPRPATGRKARAGRRSRPRRCFRLPLWPLLLVTGFTVGCFGTLVGAGGGFLLVPILLLLHPAEGPATVTGISLAVVFFNALSGSLAYARQRRIDYRSGWLFAVATVPGAVAGALATRHLARGPFDAVFGLLLLAMAAYVGLRPRHEPRVELPSNATKPTEPPPDALPTGTAVTQQHRRRGRFAPVSRTLTDVSGQTFRYTYDPRVAALLSAAVGFLSSVLGIGGGVLHVPILVQFLGFPAHVATATSHFVLAVMALAGTVTHLVTGTFATGWRRTLVLSAGVVVGAQVGARLSQRVRAEWVLRLLALALAAVGLRLL
ncbi:MAG: sulfite exporter TauE/SafE family protein, partial [Clostridia bacterium]|nr:sulfite exporter TauE/SafE family protein [Clostridia bacterium]